MEKAVWLHETSVGSCLQLGGLFEIENYIPNFLWSTVSYCYRAFWTMEYIPVDHTMYKIML